MTSFGFECRVLDRYLAGLMMMMMIIIIMKI